MMDRIRQLLASPLGKIIAIIVSIALVGIAAHGVMGFFRGDTPEAAFSSMYICTETGKPFRHQNKRGEMQPIYSPYSHKDTGVPAEPCYWTADGGTQKEPTWVLLNEAAGKTGPTFCPECGRLVVGHNPRPGPNAHAPMTQTEYAARHAADDVADGSQEESH